MSEKQKVIERKSFKRTPIINQIIKLNKPSYISNYISNDQRSKRKIENFGGDLGIMVKKPHGNYRIYK